MNTKRLLSLVCVLLMTMALFSACGAGSEASSDTENGTLPDGLSNETVVFLDENGESKYAIIRPENSEHGEAVCAGKLFKKAKATLGVTFKNTDDASDGTDKHEILIGATNRPESAKALEILKVETGGRYNDYIICTIGKKIVINAYNAESLSLATDAFCAEFLKNEQLKGGIFKTVKADGDFVDVKINEVNISEFKIVRPHYNTSYIVQKELLAMQEGIIKLTGYKVPIVDDAYVTEGDCEIIVGNALRQNVGVMSNVDEYTVKVSGKKVYINGGSDAAVGIAVTEFCKALTEKKTVTDEFELSGNYSNTVSTYDKSSYYTLVWNDEFNGTELDTTKWHYIEYESEGKNGKKSARSRNNFHFDGATMTIIPTQTEDTYYGGMIYSDTGMTFKYGLLEISAKLPDASGFWTTLWTCGKGHANKKDVVVYPEIDINESFGNGKAVAANCHSWPGKLGEEMGLQHTSCDASYSKEKVRYALDGRSFNDDFHTFGLLWTESQMSFTVDGEIYFTFDTTTSEQDKLTYNQHQFVIISMAVVLAHGAEMTTDESVWTNGKANYSVDWIRLYQLDDGKSELSDGFVYD